ncbi:MAG: Gfo/Idh/MocA family oxidoreductase [Abditibacteriales bacterium]|nr:Gfo/Idh/MocA family oxidoreductase [Abditibacteriales bacterium]MDW8367467.1 Gfo/Idh/MocA family oxidoreductase [Abditibacteriales bacterium]
MNPIKLGIIGCGAIAQIQHLPNLAGLREEFDVTMVCDVSPALAQCVAEVFRVPQHTTDYRELLGSDVDAVLLCHTDPKTEVAVAAFEAGKHVFIEKPMCFSLQEAHAIIAAAERSGKVGMVGYMKVYDPAYEIAQREVEGMEDVRFVQVNHLHPDNGLHLRQFRLKRFDDVPPDARAAVHAARQAALREAIGDAPPHVERAFFVLAGSMIHDLYGLRVLLGVPRRVVSAEIWNDGSAITTTLAYANGARGVATWVDLAHLWDFRETLEVYGDSKRVLLSYPTGFARGILSTVTVYEMDAHGATHRREPTVAWESAFVRELRHFHACIVHGTPPRTSVASAREDVALIIDIVNAYRRRQE